MADQCLYLREGNSAASFTIILLLLLVQVLVVVRLKAFVVCCS